MGKDLEAETHKCRSGRRKSLVQVLRLGTGWHQHSFRAEKWMGTVETDCNYDLLVNIPRKLRIWLTTSSLGRKSRWDTWDAESIIQTHGFTTRNEEGVTRPAIKYLYTKWSTIWVRCECCVCRGTDLRKLSELHEQYWVPYHKVSGPLQVDVTLALPQSRYLGRMVHYYHAGSVHNLTYEALRAHRIILIAGTRTGKLMNDYIKRGSYWT